MKNEQDWTSPEHQFLQAAIRINESHTKWIEVWNLVIVRLMDELSVNDYDYRVLHASRSVVQVMKSLQLFRLTMMANWNMVQDRMENTLLFESAESAGQLEAAYNELTVSVLQLHLRLLEDMDTGEEQADRVAVYRKVSCCLDIIEQWRKLTESSRGLQIFVQTDKRRDSEPGTTFSKHQNSDGRIRELLEAILKYTGRERFKDIRLLHHISSRIQHMLSSREETDPAQADPISTRIIPSGAITIRIAHKPIRVISEPPPPVLTPPGKPRPERKKPKREQAPGKVWLMKGLKSL